MPHADLPWDTLNIAQLSFPYVMAVAAITGAVDLQAFAEASRQRADFNALARRVTVAPDAQCNAEYPAHGPARVRVVLADGRAFEQYVDEPLGSPERPVPPEMLLDKFAMALESVLPPAQARALAQDLHADGAPSIPALMERLVPDAAGRSSQAQRT